MDPAFAQRSVNEGFSGGEKKRHEIVQLELLDPKVAVLDETDSGLDIDALKIVSEGVNRFKETGDKGVLLITHYTRILRYITPDFVHVFVDGRMVEEGGPELADAARGRGLRQVRRRRRRWSRAMSSTRSTRNLLPRPATSSARTSRSSSDGSAATCRWSTSTAPTPRRSRRCVIDAMVDHLERHNANVARAMHQLGAESTAAFEDARDKVARVPQRALARRGDLHQERLRGAQPGGQHARLGHGPARRRRGRPRGDHRDGAPLQHRPVAAAHRAQGRRAALVRAHRRRPARPVEHRRADHRAHQGRLADLGLQHARHDQPGRRDRPSRPRGRRRRGRRRLPGRAAAAGRRAGGRRRLPGLHRPQGHRPDRHRRALGQGRAALASCRRSSVAAR